MDNHDKKEVPPQYIEITTTDWREEKKKLDESIRRHVEEFENLLVKHKMKAL